MGILTFLIKLDIFETYYGIFLNYQEAQYQGKQILIVELFLKMDAYILFIGLNNI